MRDLLRDALENTGEYRVVAQAADGAEALRLVEEIAPDVIVMDVIMPVMDGIEACREITDKLPETRVLMLTASNEKEAVVRSIAAGATGYLQKYSGKEQLLDHPAGGGGGRVPHSGERGPAACPGRCAASSDDGASGPLKALTERETGDSEAVRRGVELPGDRGDTRHQRPDGAQRHVGHTEEAGVQDQAATGGLGGAHRPGGRRPTVAGAVGGGGGCWAHTKSKLT